MKEQRRGAPIVDTMSPQREMHTEGEKGYPWFFFYTSPSWFFGLFVTLLVLGLSITAFVWYVRTGHDASPDSIAGYACAIAGTICVVLATVLYGIRRHSRKRGMGQLNKALNWHIFLAIIGLILLGMHSFGDFNPRTGTYALYGMIALVVSGIIGRALDHLMPRLIAAQVRKALTDQGDDRIENISEKLQAIVTHNSQKLQAFPTASGSSNTERAMISLPGQAGSLLFEQTAGRTLNTPWDLGYISLEATPQELGADAPQYRFIPDKKSNLARPGALMPGAQEHISELERVQKALQREQFYRYIIRYWRIFHVGLALLTAGLTIWHLIYAAQLLIPTFMH
jgi:hypothetical protein